MKTKQLLTLLASLVICTSVYSQTATNVTIPNSSHGPFAPAYSTLFHTPRLRCQFIIGRSHLNQLAGNYLKACEFRHLNDPGLPITGGDLRLRLQISSAPNTPQGANQAFAANHGLDKTTVFDSTVHFAGALAPGGPNPTPWGNPRNVRIIFSTPFPYGGNELCLELEAWSLTGKVIPHWHGEGLIPAGRPAYDNYSGPATKGADPAFTPCLHGIAAAGETFPISTEMVAPNLPALLIVGLSNTRWGPLALPFSVYRSGTSDVPLNVGADLIFPTMAAGPPPMVDLKGNPLANQPPAYTKQGWAQINLALPWDPALAGTDLFAQWFAFTSLEIGTSSLVGLASTPALQIPLAPAKANLDLAFLCANAQDSSQTPTSAPHPTIRFSPVFRLEGIK